MNKFDLPDNPELASKMLEADDKRQEREIESGALGRFFGNNPRVPTYIAGFVAVISTSVGFIYTFLPDDWKAVPTAELWKIISPFVLACLAYIFGAASKNERR